MLIRIALETETIFPEIIIFTNENSVLSKIVKNAMEIKLLASHSFLLRPTVALA